MRKLHSLISLLLVLLMLAPCALADAPLLQAASDWNLADTPLSVTLSISLQAHAPFDETRTAMLDRVLAPLSLNLYAADGESGVSVLMNGNELLTMAQKGDAVQFSCMPNVSYASLDGNALELLLGTTSDSLDLRAVDGTFEKWIDDGWVLSNAILEPFAEYGKRKSVKTTIKDMGLARSCTDYTFSKSKLEEMQQTLLSLCPEGDLHDLIASLTFSGTQKLRVYRTEDEVPLRVEYNGVCGVDGKLRTVKLVWRTKRENGETRDEITLTSPAKSGTDKNTLDFERIMTFSSGKITMQGTCSYKVTASKQTTQTEVTFDLTNRLENDSDNVSGSVAIKQQLPDEDYATKRTITPNVVLSGNAEAPEISGTIGYQEEKRYGTTEECVITLRAARASESLWKDTAATMELSTLSAETLQNLRSQLSHVPANVASRVLHDTHLTRRHVLKGLLLLLGVGGGWQLWQSETGEGLRADYRTDKGAVSHQLLEDDSQLTLNTQSAADVPFDVHQRAVHLWYGEIAITTAKDAQQRPFRVMTR